MATAPNIPLAFFQNEGSADISLRHLWEGASQTFTKGAPVAYSGGYVVVHDPSKDSDTEGIPIGLALSPGNNTTAGTYRIPVQMFDQHTRLIANLKENADANHTYAAADRGTVVDLQWDATNGIWTWNTTIDEGGQTDEGRFRIVDIHRNWAIGDVNVWAICAPVVQNATITGGTEPTNLLD